tara:strand:+ start:1511 stop:1765 length:255 start_codon:yes stop_codon:yes gene_type:complete
MNLIHELKKLGASVQINPMPKAPTYFSAELHLRGNKMKITKRTGVISHLFVNGVGFDTEFKAYDHIRNLIKGENNETQTTKATK